MFYQAIFPTCWCLSILMLGLWLLLYQDKQFEENIEVWREGVSEKTFSLSGIVLVGLVGSLMANVNTIPSWKTAWLVLSWMDFSITSVVFDSEYSFLLCHSHNNRHGLPCHHRVSSRLIPLLLHIQVSSSRNSSPISSSLITNRR